MKKLKFNISQFSRLKTSRISVICIGGILPLFIFASLFLLSSCEREDMYSFAQNKLAIGDKGPGGGIVFYVTDGGLHGLEAAPAGWSGGGADPGAVWADSPYISLPVPAGTSAGIGSGMVNTYAIIGQNGYLNPYAAKKCRDYHGGDKSDWFLPSQDELNLMYTNLMLKGLGSFVDDFYWSSTESPPSSAWAINFLGGGPTGTSKNSGSVYIRPVRSF